MSETAARSLTSRKTVMMRTGMYDILCVCQKRLKKMKEKLLNEEKSVCDE